VTETDQISKPNREVKVKRSCHRRGRCFALFGGFLVGPQLQVKQLSHAFLFVYKLTAGRVKQKLYKMKKVMFTAFAVGLGLTASIIAQVPNYVPTNGLVGWWPFNGNANDESGNGNIGTVNGATLTTDRFGNIGKAYSFDGVDDYINGQLSSPLVTIGSGITISTWINIPIVASAPQFNLVDNNGSGYGLWSNFINNNYVISGLCGNAFVQPSMLLNDPNPPVINTWHSVIMTCDLSSVDSKLFIDGNIVAQSNSSQIQGAFDLFTFGKWPGNNVYLNGKLDDIGLWNRALTQQEISDLYNANICYEFVTVTDTLVINTGITGYNPITYLNTLKIWPNPSNDHITIDAGNLATMNGYSIKIEDAQGQQVFQNAVNQQQFYVDITTWGGNGLYFVRIIDPQGNTVDIKKIVLQ
jgi:hypothetical protein